MAVTTRPTVADWIADRMSSAVVAANTVVAPRTIAVESRPSTTPAVDPTHAIASDFVSAIVRR